MGITTEENKAWPYLSQQIFCYFKITKKINVSPEDCKELLFLLQSLGYSIEYKAVKKDKKRLKRWVSVCLSVIFRQIRLSP
jgi:hypothetical protein